MISAEAPILFAKGCDIFITELTMRAWLHAEECKRRTLQRSDIANAIKKIDMFDFLIDIVPREEKVAVKTEKIEYQDHQSPYYGLGMPQGGHQFNTSLPSIPVDHKIMVDPLALHEQQQLQYMQRMESQHQQILHDHQHQQHQQPPTLLPPLTPVAGQQVSPYRAQNRPQYASASANVSAGPPSVRQVTTEQPYQHHPYYQHSNFQQHSQELHHHQHQTPSQHRQSDHNPVQVKYEFESPRPVDWYPQANTHTNSGLHNSQSGYVPHTSSGHSYGEDQSSHDYNHDGTGMHLTRHDEGYVRGGGVQRN